MTDDIIERYFASAAVKRLLRNNQHVDLLITAGHILALLNTDHAVYQERLVITRVASASVFHATYVVDVYVPEEGLNTVFAVIVNPQEIRIDTFAAGTWTKDIVDWEAALVARRREVAHA